LYYLQMKLSNCCFVYRKIPSAKHLKWTIAEFIVLFTNEAFQLLLRVPKNSISKAS
jgi:hypothetical protein